MMALPEEKPLQGSNDEFACLGQQTPFAFCATCHAGMGIFRFMTGDIQH